MKLLKQGEHWEFALEEQEFHYLVMLVEAFPISGIAPAKISTTTNDAAMQEREKLLNECLAEHRKELRTKAQELIGPAKWQHTKEGSILRISAEEREVLLGILNDIRVECWRLLGEPEELEREPSDMSLEQLKCYHFMHLAGYFQHHLLGAPEDV